jgi:DNA repair exonuclease SbcCD ATPase subunit|tara:strand:+ start:38 stop:1030 length:993 start_codon:yes stop_codon:yes gene_type:complete
MPEEAKTVDIDTSGPGAEINLQEDKKENEIEVSNETVENNTESNDSSEESNEQLDVQSNEQETEKKEEVKKEDDKLEEYSKGVQARIAKLTRKMREAERREQAAVEYARSVEEKRKQMETSFQKSDLANLERFEKNIDAGLQAAERELAAAIESADAKGQIAANKRIAELSFENARIKQAKQQREQVKTEEPVKPADSGNIQQNQLENTPMPDPKAEAWATKNTWFGTNRAMTNTAIAHHQDLENEGYDTTSDEYYQEIDRRMKVDFPAKFGNNQAEKTSAPVQTVASASRSVKPGRKTVRLTSSQVAIAKKLGVPLEEYAKQLKTTKEA